MTNKTYTLEGFLAAYTVASEELKQSALAAAMAVLGGTPPAVRETYLTARQVADRYGLNETTVWRWKFPHESWGGLKRYKASECDAYVNSDALHSRRVELRQQRAREPKRAESKDMSQK